VNFFMRVVHALLSVIAALFLFYFLVVHGQTGGRLWLLALEDGSLTWLPSKGRGATRPSVADRSRVLVYEEEYICCNIMRTEVGESVDPIAAGHRLIASTLNDYWPLYSPSGNQILFISTRTGNPEIWICDGEGRNVTGRDSSGRKSVKAPTPRKMRGGRNSVRIPTS